jgi:peroxiredoxin
MKDTPKISSAFPLPPDLPVPSDDGACAHLTGMRLSAVELLSTKGAVVNLGELRKGRTIIYCYPMTGVPGKPLPEGWDMIPGARGCTPQSCGFRDHFEEIEALGADVFGLSTQKSDYQLEMVERLQLPFPVLSDAELKFCRSLRLPTFKVDGMTLVKRLTLVIRDGVIERVFYPVFPPDHSAEQVVHWLRDADRRA